jgi:hypothetical protein
MSEWEVSMEAIRIALLDSQDMYYSVRLQKISKIALAQRQLHQ